MYTKNSDYWKERFSQLEDAANKDSFSLRQDVETEYIKADQQIQMQIESWYQRFATNNQVSISEARRVLNTKELAEFRWTVQEYIKYGEQAGLNPKWMKQLENASARYHVSRLEALKLQTQQTIEVLYGNQTDSIDDLMRRAYSKGYYRTAFEIQRGFNIGWDVASVDSRRLERLISKPWAADGKNFSDRIWTARTSLINEVHTQLTQTCLMGKAPDSAINAIAKRFNVSKQQAGRLVMTESAYFASASQKDAFNELDVEQFEIVATLDSHTSATCQEMDGKIFSMKDYEPGLTAPPFHVWCRSCTVPWFADNYGGERAARGEDGKTYYVPADMKYPDWKKKFVDGGSKKDLTQVNESDKVGLEKERIKDLKKLKSSGMAENEYDEYLSLINNHNNPSVRRLYSKYGDEVKGVKMLDNGGRYSPSLNSLEFSYPKYADMHKYSTLSHEYGHFFDSVITFEGAHFQEIEAVRNATGMDVVFKKVTSSSDEFLAAIRKDKAHIENIFTTEEKADLLAHNASNGVQDVIAGLIPESKVRWGHTERYYNRRYAQIESADKVAQTSIKKVLKQAYKAVGLDATSQAQVKTICRQYEVASEAWASLVSAEVCGCDALVYVKKYLPNSYSTMLEILKGAK